MYLEYNTMIKLSGLHLYGAKACAGMTYLPVTAPLQAITSHSGDNQSQESHLTTLPKCRVFQTPSRVLQAPSVYPAADKYR